VERPHHSHLFAAAYRQDILIILTNHNLAMRFIGAVLLLLMFLFNWFGYRLVIGMLETRANSALEAQFDESRYDESQLFTIKVPVRYLPYYTNSSDYQRVDGQIEIGGIQYKYVKRRIFHDSLEMLCLPNHTAMRLRTAANEFFKFSNDLTHEKKPGDNHARKHFSIDNYTMQTHAQLTTPERDVIVLPACSFSPLPLLRASPGERPPELA
jgi:hypothetical protein